MSQDATSKSISPEFFFEQVVPQVFAATQNVRERAKISGTCEFQLSGPSSTTTWTVDLGKGTVGRQSIAAPDLYLEMRNEDFSSMLVSKLDVRAAVTSGRVRVQGKVPLLQTLAMILRPRTLPY